MLNPMHWSTVCIWAASGMGLAAASCGGARHASSAIREHTVYSVERWKTGVCFEKTNFRTDSTGLIQSDSRLTPCPPFFFLGLPERSALASVRLDADGRCVRTAIYAGDVRQSFACPATLECEVRDEGVTECPTDLRPAEHPNHLSIRRNDETGVCTMWLTCDDSYLGTPCPLQSATETECPAE